MRLVRVKVGPFRSINTTQTVEIDEAVTVLVGMNEAGKTVLLKALEKSADALSLEEFDPVEDYPRKELSAYLKRQVENPDVATELTYQLTPRELAVVNAMCHVELGKDFEFTVAHLYNNKTRTQIELDEKPALRALVSSVGLSTDAKTAISAATAVREVPEALSGVELTDVDSEVLSQLKERINKSERVSVVEHEVWQWLERRLPQFLYFGDYDLLPSKINLQDLKSRNAKAVSNPDHLTPGHRAVLALIRMADISIDDFADASGYEPLKAKLEAVSISLTDQIMEFWKQNEDLEVEVDIKSDAADEAPFNNGPNLYLRIKNRRHRGVSTPFGQRSRGFIWFFSFLVWFDSVKHQINGRFREDSSLILLLDEPGLALHALAQSDFLRYIDELSTKHQVLYTTHSPFMVHSDRLHQVRVVEDRDRIGTIVTGNILDSSSRTIFPLQAALGWTLAQNLFIGAKNLLVEGPSELLYLKIASTILESMMLTGLQNDITIVPVGGLDKVATFVALLAANDLKLAVLHDYAGNPDQRLSDLSRQKLILEKAILNVSQFRDANKVGVNSIPSDIEDLFESKLYLELFSKTFEKQLAGKMPVEADLPPGDRIVCRLERWLIDNDLKLRPSGGFNHYLVALTLASKPPKTLHGDSLKRFDALFRTLNGIYGS
ncbi:AAA family ATPase [Verrucomicrobium spinosum]|uniref:AAA family ATPase n=1 Tax=Verrucomicrobium spinosum TaxID=2736 RepID=UPI0002DE85F6|nr:AAA family ATPase [Verrucomicrobium spinosum]